MAHGFDADQSSSMGLGATARAGKGGAVGGSQAGDRQNDTLMQNEMSQPYFDYSHPTGVAKLGQRAGN